MNDNELIRKLKKIKYTQGIRSTHYTVWNCPCSSKLHAVGVGNHGSQESYFLGWKKQLGPHYKNGRFIEKIEDLNKITKN